MNRNILILLIVLFANIDFTSSRREFKSAYSALDDGYCRALSFEGEKWSMKLYCVYIMPI